MVCQPLASVTRFFEMITMSWGCSSPALTNKDRFPYFFSSLLSEVDIAKGLFSLFKHFSWSKHSLLIETAEIYQLTSDAWTAEMADHGLELLSSNTFPALSDVHLRDVIRKKTRVNVVLAYAPITRRILCMAHGEGLIGQEYVWIIPGFLMDSPDWWRSSTHPDENLACDDDTMLEAALGSWGVIGKFTDSGPTTVLPGGLTPPEWSAQIAPFIEADTDIVRLGYDGFWVWALALHKYLVTDGNSHTSLGQRDPAAREALMNAMWDLNFEGISGPFEFGANGMRASPMNVRQKDTDPSTGFTVVGTEFTGSVTFNNDGADVIWGDGSTGAANAPDGEPPVEIDPSTLLLLSLGSSDGGGGLAVGIIILIVAVVLVVFGAILILVLYSQRKRAAELRRMNDTSWIISDADVRMDTKHTGVSRSRMSGISKVSSNCGQSVYSNMNGQVYTLRGDYQGNDCAVKRLPGVDKGAMITDEVRRDVRAVRDCNHANLNKFVGAIMEAPVSLLWEYCTKGSLEDAIQNDALQLE